MAIRDAEGNSAEISVPLEEWVKQIAEHAAEGAAKRVVKEMRDNCPAVSKMEQIDENSRAITKIRVKFGILVGYMIGAGLIAGTTAVAVSKAFGM